MKENGSALLDGGLVDTGTVSLGLPGDAGSVGAYRAVGSPGIGSDLVRCLGSTGCPTARALRRERRAACRDALLEWLYEQPGQVPAVGPFLADTRAYFFGDRFTEDEANEALDHLGEVGLAKGISAAWGGSLLRPEVTADGKICVERYDSNVGAWLARATPGPSVTILHSHGVNIAVNSPGANQTVTITTDARQQMLQTADALAATLPVLGLDPEEMERARDIADRLRAEARQEYAEPRGVRALLEDVRTIAVAGSGSAAGVGIPLVQDIAQSLGV